MAWNDRIIKATYTSPNGNTLEFDYEDVGREFDKRTTPYSFPDSAGTYVQDMGVTDKRYPLRMFFWGDDHDLQAAAFEEILSEQGHGTLNHPMYGIVTVVPFGTISRRDDLKTASNQSVIEVTFWETIPLVFSFGEEDDLSGVVITALDEYNEAKAAEFARLAELGTEVERTSIKGTFDSLLKKVKTGLNAIADTQESVRKQFNAINDSINNGIDTIIGEPITLAFQTTLLIQSPARAITSISAKLKAYKDLASSIVAGNGAVVTRGYGTDSGNKFQVRDIHASGYVTGSILSAVNHEFSTKREALEAAESIITQFDELNVWRESNYLALSLNDDGESYQKLLSAVGYATGYLVQLSFSLKQEYSVVLQSDRSIVDLCSELYGGIDELDFFVSSNDLSGDEILEIPRGREIVYYV